MVFIGGAALGSGRMSVGSPDRLTDQGPPAGMELIPVGSRAQPVSNLAEAAQAVAPKDTTLADIISSTGARVVKAADTILATTNPPPAAEMDLLPESVARWMRVDQALAQGRQTARTRPGARHEPAPSRAGHPTVAPAR